MINTKSFKALSEDSRFIKLSESNKKLQPTKDIKFLIWNIPSKTTCPFATEHCKKFCYAVKAETAYPTCLPSRLKHFEASQRDDFVSCMIFTIKAYINKPSYLKAKKIVVRIHESGDFYNFAYMGKWYKIAEHFKSNKRIVFMAYTKSVAYVDCLAEIGHAKPKNMIIRFSIWDDTEPNQIYLAEKHNLPIYTAVEKFTAEPSQNRCLCRDCANCGKCWSKTKSIICEIH